MAVYTPLSNEVIAAHLGQCYSVGRLDNATGIVQGVENTNYLLAVTRPDGAAENYILTLYEKRTDPADLPFFLGLLQYLAARGIACPKPVMRRDGALFGALAGKQAALVSFLRGESCRHIGTAQAASVGAALGQLHRAGEGFPLTRRNTLALAGWQEIHAKIAGRLDEIAPGLEALVRDEMDYAAQHFLQNEDLPTGIIHADLFPDNVFFVGDEVSGIIDFYFACRDRLAYDVAITLNAWCFEPDGAFSPQKSQALLAQYQQQRPFMAAERAAFPALLRGAALRFLLTRAHDWLTHDPQALVQPHDPREYAAKLRFHRQADGAGLYGI
ncbi:MAG: homoserine kinase [Alphaproteobacteria bacterium]|nr:homoserine kinase [Alphaproteobacteria bacterium]